VRSDPVGLWNSLDPPIEKLSMTHLDQILKSKFLSQASMLVILNFYSITRLLRQCFSLRQPLGAGANHWSMPVVPMKVLKCTRLAHLASFHIPICLKHKCLTKQCLKRRLWAILTSLVRRTFLQQCLKVASGEICKRLGVSVILYLNFMYDCWKNMLSQSLTLQVIYSSSLLNPTSYSGCILIIHVHKHKHKYKYTNLCVSCYHSKMTVTHGCEMSATSVNVLINKPWR
jgi:hypothetical protein